MAKRIVVFNHKGGVSKTTSIYNIGWMLSKEHNVLLVDGDPQCNLTSLILGDEFEKYYLDDETKNQNIKDGVQVAFSGKPYPIEAVGCFSPSRASSLYLLAGHANLSEYDAALTFAQLSNSAMIPLQNLPGAFSELIQLTEERYAIDYTLIDVSSTLSSINQNLFLLSHAFIVPTNIDPFSTIAIDTLSQVLSKWVFWKKNNISSFADSAYSLSKGEPKFLGTLIQPFNIRNGQIKKPYRDNITEIQEKISNDFMTVISKAEMTLTPEQYTLNLINHNYCLAQIPSLEFLDKDINNLKTKVLRQVFDSLSTEIKRLLSYV